jgi:hypothetical protein
MTDELYQRLALKDRVKYNLGFWAISLVASIYIVPMVLLSVVNPFWFREAFGEMVQDHIHDIAIWRKKMLKPIVDKYTAFEILKKKQA